MARIHGRNARLLIEDTPGSGVLIPALYVSSFEEGATTDRVDVTAFGDTGQVQVAGLPKREGSYSGFYDDASSTLYRAALDGLPRVFQFYPNYNKLQYTYGLGNFDFSRTTPVDGAVAISGNWSAAGAIGTYG